MAYSGNVQVLAVDYTEGESDNWGEVRVIFTADSNRAYALPLARRVQDQLVQHGLRVNNNVLERRAREQFTLIVQFVSGPYVFTGEHRRDQLSPQLQGQMIGMPHFIGATMLLSIRDLAGVAYPYTGTIQAKPIYDNDGKIVNHRLAVERRMSPERQLDIIDIGTLDETDWWRRYDRHNLRLVFEPGKSCGMNPAITHAQVQAAAREVLVKMEAYPTSDVTYVHCMTSPTT